MKKKRKYKKDWSGQVLGANTSEAMETKGNTEKWVFIKLAQHSKFGHQKRVYRTCKYIFYQGTNIHNA